MVDWSLYDPNEPTSSNTNQIWAEIKDLTHTFTHSRAVDELVCDFDYYWDDDQKNGQNALLWTWVTYLDNA